MQRKIKTRQTEGLNARVFITPDIAYSDSATFGAFVTEAVEGEVGAFAKASTHNSDSQATLLTGALGAGIEFFIAQKQGDLIKKTPTMKEGELNIKNWIEFCLPVKQVQAVGYNGTDGDLNDVIPVINIDDNYEMSVIETTEGYQPYPTWQYSYTAKVGDTIEDIVDAIAAQINDDLSIQNKENEPLVLAEVLGNNTLVGGAWTSAVVNGSANVTTSGAHSLVVGDFLEIAGVNYKVKSAPTTTTLVLTSPYQGVTAAAAVSDGITSTAEIGVRFTAKETQDTFHIALKENFEGALNRLVTGFKEGSGYVEHMENLEYEGQIFDGTTTVNAAFADKFGEQTDYRIANKGYDVIHIGQMANVASKALPHSVDTQESHVMIAGPTPSGTIALPYVATTVAGGTNVITNFKTIFAV